MHIPSYTSTYTYTQIHIVHTGTVSSETRLGTRRRAHRRKHASKTTTARSKEVLASRDRHTECKMDIYYPKDNAVSHGKVRT